MTNRLLFFLVSCMALSFTGYGQITLSQTDIASPGDIVYDQSTAFPASAPPSGTNQTWDFSNPGDSLFLDTTFFRAPSSTPYATAITGSNLAMISGTSYQFFEKSASGFFLKGFVFEVPPLPINLPFTTAPFNITPKIPIIKFPATYGQTNTGTGEGSFEFNYDTTVNGIHITKVKIIATITVNDTIDGWGDAQFAGTTVASLRQTQWQEIKLRAQGYTVLPIIGGTWVPLPVSLPGFGNKSVLWWGNGYKSPIASFTMDSSGNAMGNSFQRSLLVVTGSRNPVQQESFDVFPNPASTAIYWAENNNLKTVHIFSADGKLQVKKTIIPGETSLTTEQLPNGLYQVQVKTETGEFLSRKLVISK